jgi:O-antigen ligase
MAMTIGAQAARDPVAVTARLRFLGILLVVVFAAVGLGLVLDRAPYAALAAVTIVVIAALAAQVARLPAALVFGGAVVLSSALVDLPGKVPLGGFTANAGLTFAYAFFGALIVALWPRSTARQAARALTPFMGLVLLGLLSTFGWGEQSIAAIQSILVLFVFIVSVLCGFAIAENELVPGRFAAKAFGTGSIVALALYAASVAAGGVGSGAVIGTRSFALFALLVISWGVAGWRYHARLGRTLTLLSGILILLSLSRMAFAAALVVVCIAWLNPRTIGGWFRFIAVIGVTLGIAYFAVQEIEPLRERIYTGELQSIGGGVSINFSGRSELWPTTWHSYLTSPYIGHGAGSADNLITRVFSKAIGHPHNDYLTLLHDYGLLGACLWVIGYGGLLIRSWRSWQRPGTGVEHGGVSASNGDRRIHAAAFLSLFGVAIAMITDNPIDYLFVLGPLGVLVGVSMGLEARSPRVGAPARSRASVYAGRQIQDSSKGAEL